MDDRRSATVRLDDVVKRYGERTVVRDVGFETRAGECLALLGHNGAGKSTLIKLMLGLTRASSGRIEVLGEDPLSRAAVEARRRIGFLPENVAFHDALTGREAIRFYARLQGAERGAGDALLDRVGLEEAADRRVRTYSKGMRQRLGLAQALLGDPALLLLDEPTTGLDPELRQAFYDLVDERCRAGATALISSHSLSEIESHADRVAILQQGRLVALGTLDELRAQAGLPVRIRVTAAQGEAARLAAAVDGMAELTYVNDRRFDLACLDGRQMSVVRHLAGLGEPVRDVEVAPPRLEQIYAHFTAKESRP